MEETVADYAPKKRETEAERRVKAMFANRLELDAKPFFALNTSLTTSPHLMAFATKPKFSKAEAMERMRARYGV